MAALTKVNNKTSLLWKPTPGKHHIRIVPYKFDMENPFIELKFHYNVGGKTYLSPDTFNRPDPIVEFSNSLKKTGSKEDWLQGRKLEPKLRTYVPILVRGKEDEGVKFWGFGKKVYEEFLKIMSDPDEYGNILDLEKGRDAIVEFTAAEATGKSFPETTIRMKLTTSPAIEESKKYLLENQTKVTDIWPELSYEDLKKVMQESLTTQSDEHPEDSSEENQEAGSISASTTENVNEKLDKLFGK